MYKENPLTVTTAFQLWEVKTAVIVYRSQLQNKHLLLLIICEKTTKNRI